MKNIYFENGLEGVERLWRGCDSVFVVADSSLRDYYGYFEGCEIIEIETSETLKTLSTVEYIAEQLLESGAHRGSLIVGFGGGITTDLVGFVASIYMRGVRFGFVPTSLLSQVDAAVGGKNGVNFLSYKNILGVINQPEFVYISSSVLKTMPERHIRAGIAEMLKIFIIYDSAYYLHAVDYFSRQGSDVELLELVRRSVELKCAVVQQDERENGERKKLNLGHTFAHAIEKIVADRGLDILHGEAVAVGLRLAALTAEKFADTDNSFSNLIANDLARVGLPFKLPEGISLRELIVAMVKDKKVQGDMVSLILPFAFERVEIVDIELKKIEEVIGDLS